MPEPVVRQSGVIPYRLDEDGEPEVLLVTSTSGARWIVPKGHLEPHLTARASAVKEAFEEAGAVGIATEQPVGAVRYRKAGARCHVELYLLEVAMVVDAWPERGRRRRRWVPASEATAMVRFQGFAACIARLLAHLDGETCGDAVAA